MKLEEVEKVRKRATQSLCTYEIRGAYVRIHATQLLSVCDALIKQMKSQQLELKL